MVILNPYARNLDLSQPNDAKLFSKATASSAKKFDLSNKTEEAEDFKLLIEEAARMYAWGDTVTDIPVEWEGELVSDSRDLLVHFRKFTLNEILRAQGVSFGCEFSTKMEHDFIILNTDNAEDNAVRMKSVMIGFW